MKKLTFILMASMIISAPSFASESVINQEAMETATGGFQGPVENDTLSTVEEVMNAGWLTDGNKVTLNGHIIKSMGNDVYIFKDQTGEMRVEIESDEWRGQTITPTHKVQVIGEVEKNNSDVAVEVDSILIMK